MPSEKPSTESTSTPTRDNSAAGNDPLASLQDHLAPGETVLWHASPRIQSAVAGAYRELPWIAAGWLIVAGGTIISLSSAHWLLILCATLLAVGGVAALAHTGYRRLVEAQETIYAVTNHRLIKLRTDGEQLQIDARDLGRCSNPRIISRRHGTGDIVVPANYGVIRAPMVLIGIHAATEVGHLITDARRQRQLGEQETDQSNDG